MVCQTQKKPSVNLVPKTTGEMYVGHAGRATVRTYRAVVPLKSVVACVGGPPMLKLGGKFVKCAERRTSSVIGRAGWYVS